MVTQFKWFGLKEYDLKLFLIKGRFFLAGAGLETNKPALMALGFREVPKNPAKPSSQNYWSAKPSKYFMRRIAAAFPNYTEEMMPPEAINPTILVNKTQSLKGGIKNGNQRPSERASNARKPVAEVASGDLHSASVGVDGVLGKTGSPDDSGDQSTLDDGESGGGNIPSVAGLGASEMRGSGSSAPRKVEEVEPSAGVGELSGSDNLEQSGEIVEQGSGVGRSGGEPTAASDDGRGREFLLKRTDDVAEVTMVDYVIFDKANKQLSAAISAFAGSVSTLKHSVDSALELSDYTQLTKFDMEHSDLSHRATELKIENYFFSEASGEGVAKVFDGLEVGQDILLDDAKPAFHKAGYGALYDDAIAMHGLFNRSPSTSTSTSTSISIDDLKLRIVDRIIVKSGFDDTTPEAESDEANYYESYEDLGVIATGIIALKDAAANAQSDQAVDPMLAEYAFFDMAYSRRERAVQKFYSDVTRLHRGVLSSLGLGDPSGVLQEFETKHDELNRAVPDLKFESIFFEGAAGQGVTKVFDAFKVDQGIALDEAKSAFDAAGYGALYENAMSVNEASDSQVTTISYSDLKLKIVDGIERMESAYMNENNPFRERDDQFELDYYVALDLLDDISNNIAQLRSEVEASADSEVDFDDNENDEVDEPHYQAAVFLFREQRQSVGNRVEDDDVRRRTKELAAVTSVNHVRTVMVLDMIATRMDMESLQFAEDLKVAAPSVDGGAQELAKRVADDASNFTLTEYLELATVTKLENHGRKWEVRYGSGSGFSDAEDEVGAIAEHHEHAVSNALYYNSPENINTLNIPLPRVEVLAEYPYLVERFATAFIVDRPEAEVEVDGFTKAYNVYGYDVLAYEREGVDGGDTFKRFVVQTEENRLSAERGVYDLDGSDVVNTLGVAFEEALWQYGSKFGEIRADEALAESKSNADDESTSDNNNEPDIGSDPIVVGTSDAVTGTSPQEQGSESESPDSLSVVARMAALGYAINTDTLNPFEGVSETYRELLATTNVVVTSRELYKDFIIPRTGAQTQTLIMNAPRPMMGGVEFEADFFAGRYYALVDTADSNAGFQVETNVKMDASLPVYMDENTQIAFALQRSRYGSSYLDMLESGETTIDRVAEDVLKHRDYTIRTLEAAIVEFKASFAASTSLSQETKQEDKEPLAGGVFNLNDHPFNFTLSEWNDVAVATMEFAQPWRITNGTFTDTVDMASDSEDALAVSHRSSVREALELNLPSSNNPLKLPIPSGAVLLSYPILVEEYADAFLVSRPDAKADLAKDGLDLTAYNFYGYEVYKVTDAPANGNRTSQYFVQSHANKAAGRNDVYTDDGNYTANGLENALFTVRDEFSRGIRLGVNIDAVAQPEPTPATGNEIVTPESAGNSKAGDIVRTEDGEEYLLMRARFDFVEAHPIVEGKSQVSADTAIRFHLRPDSEDTNPNRDHRTVFHTGRNYYVEQSAALADSPVDINTAELGGLGSDGAPVDLSLGNDAPAYAGDTDDVEEREWTGLILKDLKDAEAEGRVDFRTGLNALIMAEQGTAFSDMSYRAITGLLQFTGWGGVYDDLRLDKRSNYKGANASSALDMAERDFHSNMLENRLESYYTPSNVIESMWKGIQAAGVPASARYLEPAVGAAHFFVGAPAEVQAAGTLVGIDCDPIAVRIAKALAPDASIIESRYESVILDNNFDVVIGNVPFGNTRVSDSRYPSPLLIHDYFIKRSLTHLKVGGLMSIVTTSGTMDKLDDSIRSDIMATADLVAGVRLPSEVFARDNAKVVTDILVFQKRPDGTQPSFDFTATQMQDVEGENFRVNNFFVDNPQFILGDVVQTSGQFGPKMNVTSNITDLGERIDAALAAQITGPIFNRSDWIKVKSQKNDAIDKPAWDEGAFVVDSDLIAGRMTGEYLVVNDKLVEVIGTQPQYDESGVYFGDSALVADVVRTEARTAVILDFIKLRDAALVLSNAQLEGSDEELLQAQASAQVQYNNFVDNNGSVNLRKNTLAYESDPRSSEVMALELFDDDKNEVLSLAETLTKRVVGSSASVKINTAEDAFYVCIDKKGSIDFDYMSEISGLGVEEIKDDLLGHLVYIDPKTHEYIQSDVYLSGNIAQKLNEAEQAVKFDSITFGPNVAALNEVRPLMLPFEDISIALGSSWIPTEEIHEFVANMCGEEKLSGRELSVRNDPDTGTWKVDALASFEKNNDVVMRSRLGNERVRFTKMLEMALNGKRPSHTMKTSDNKTVPNHEATAASRAKQDEVKEAFVTWVGATDERKAKYAAIYHEKINVIALPKIDGSRITFEGMSANWKPRPHQSDVVAAALRGYNTMSAHPVGSGKTFEMVATAMKLKQVGMCTKPMIAVPNHMLGQMAREAKEIFPSAKVLMVTNEDLKLENRKRFFAVARNNDWDLIVCTHSMLNRIEAPFPIKLRSVDMKIDHARRSLDKAETAGDKKRGAERLAEATSKKAAMIQSNKEALVDPKKAPMLIEDIGVDTLFVDEQQQYKNLDPETSMQVLGLRTSGSQRATNLLELSIYLRELHGKCAGLHGYTGTPVANSMSELYTHMRFLRPDILESMGMNTFDQWAMNFCEVVSKAEVLADGGTVAMRDRLSKFKNLPELIKLFRSFADVRSHAELNLPTPELESKLIVVPQTELEKAHMTHLAIRAVATRLSGADKSVDNILNIATDGRKAALDMQMVDHRFPVDASLKLTMVAENVMSEWSATHKQKGTQLVFMDIGTPSKDKETGEDKKFSGYAKLRDKLIEQGMPRDQIAFIHDANTDAKKETLFKKVRSGQVRVLLGSTEKMGVGTNVQERMCAVHNVDCPWRPDQLEQRIGRIMRQGNLYFNKVTEYKYVRKDSLENFMWQGLNTKKAFISQAMGSPDKAAREYEEEINAGYGDVLAAATGEPRIRDKFEIDADVQKLERHKKNWVIGQAFSRDALASMRKEIVKIESSTQVYKGVHAALPNATYKAITVEGAVYGIQDGSVSWLGATDAGRAIQARVDNVTAKMGRMNEKSKPLNVRIGEIEMVVEHNARGQIGIRADLNGRSVPDFAIYEMKNPKGLGTAVRSLYNAAARVRDYIEEKAVIEKSISRVPAAQSVWPDEQKLIDANFKKKELDDWFVAQDFDKRFEGVADPFIPLLDEYIREDEARIALSGAGQCAGDEVELFIKEPVEGARQAESSNGHADNSLLDDEAFDVDEDFGSEFDYSADQEVSTKAIKVGGPSMTA